MLIRLKPIKQIYKNAKDWPSEYVVNFIESGLVDYSDVGAAMAMLKKETIIKMLPTFVGKPVVIDHIDVSPKDFMRHAVGFVTRCWWDDMSGWAYCSFILTDDKAKEKVANGYSVSCAYDNVQTGKGGSWHAIDYQEEITDGVFNHLALVTNPRYEDCQIQPTMMLINSKKAVIKEGEGKRNIVTFKNATKAPSHPQEKVVFKPMHRICDSCEYLCSDHCDVAGKGGKITLEYAGKRLLGLAEDCSAYEEKSKEGRMNVKIKIANEEKISQVTKDTIKKMEENLADAQRQSDKDRIDEIKAELKTYPKKFTKWGY